jgi:hypothetical protein
MYLTDKNARNWSFRYYLSNARHALNALSNGGLSLVDKSDLAKPAETDKDDWVEAQAILDKAIERFAAAMLQRSV